MQGGSGPTVEATVKWFNAEKGFGFAEIADGSGDAFLTSRPFRLLAGSLWRPGLN